LFFGTQLPLADGATDWIDHQMVACMLQADRLT